MALKLPLDTVFTGLGQIEHTRILSGQTNSLVSRTNDGKISIDKFIYRIVKYDGAVGQRKNTFDVTCPNHIYTLAELRAAAVTPADDLWSTTPGTLATMYIMFDEKGVLKTISGLKNPSRNQRINNIIIAMVQSFDGINISHVYQTIFDNSPITEMIDAHGVINISDVTLKPIPNTMMLSLDEMEIFTEHVVTEGNHYQTLPAQNPVAPIIQRFDDGSLALAQGATQPTTFLNPRAVHIPNGITRDPVDVADDEITIIHAAVGQITGFVVFSCGHFRFKNMQDAINNAHKEIPYLAMNMSRVDNYVYLNTIAIRGGATNLADENDALFGFYQPELNDIIFPGHGRADTLPTDLVRIDTATANDNAVATWDDTANKWKALPLPAAEVGATWRHGTTVPLDTLGNDGDWYINTKRNPDNNISTIFFYQKVAGKYSVVTHLDSTDISANGESVIYEIYVDAADGIIDLYTILSHTGPFNVTAINSIQVTNAPRGVTTINEMNMHLYGQSQNAVFVELSIYNTSMLVDGVWTCKRVNNVWTNWQRGHYQRSNQITFTSADLTLVNQKNTFVFNHDLNLDFPNVVLIDNNNQIQLYSPKIENSNTITIDFGFQTITGTWKIYVSN